ncbi:hypothetical protein vseg_002572 [Gypsophila vaccaria]
MEISEKELEKRLLDAGNKLLSPPSSVAELLSSLDLVENLLSGVEQSPSESMKEALVPSTKALITDELLRHSDVDVKVSVASCISEITRITAPEAPYADDQMKEVFQLIVSSFEKLDDKSSRSYTKRISILETVAKVRSCVVMLDLECAELIVEMFRHFLRTIRDDHPAVVFSSMDTIMALVVDESEDISVDLLSPMLGVLKKDNKEVLPIACQLVENVITKCADKLKPYLLPAIRSIGTSLDDYTKAVSDVYQAGDEAVKPTDGDASNTNLAVNNDVINLSSEQADEVAMESLEDAPPSEEAAPITLGSSKTVVGNGILQKGEEDSSAVNDNSLETDHDTQDEKGEPSKTSVGDLTAEEPPKSKTKPKKSNKRKGKKQKSSKKNSEPLEPVTSNQETAPVDTPDHQDDSMDVDNLQSEDPAVDTTDAANNEKSSDAPISSPKMSNNECADVSPPSPSGSRGDETNSKKAPSSPSGSLGDETPLKEAGQGKQKGDPVQEGETAHEVDAAKESDIKKDSEEAASSKSKPDKHDSKNSPSASDHEESVPDSVDDSKKEDDNIQELNDHSAKDLAKETGSQLADKKKRVQAKATPAKGHKKTPAKDEKKKAVALPKSTLKAAKDGSDAKDALKSSSKRKRPSEVKPSKSKVYGGEVVGATVKVLWPEDDEYYEGVIESFDAAKKRHKISYFDGDVEVLNLREERWMFVNYSEGNASDGEGPADSGDEMPLSTKMKTSATGSGAKQTKTGISAKKSGTSSSKSKAVSKSESNDRVTAGTSKEESTKKVGKSDVDKSGKSKASKSGNKLSDDTLKSGKTSKDEDLDTIKVSSKSKQDTTKSAVKSKGKSPKSVPKSNTSTSGKGKAAGTTSTKDEETEDESDEPARTPEKSKTKSQSASKSKNSLKKRKRT